MLKLLQVTFILLAFADQAWRLRIGRRFCLVARVETVSQSRSARQRAAFGCLLVFWLLPAVASAQSLTHRYSFFNEPNGSIVATDLVASANGTLKGSAAITGGELMLNGSIGTYLNLPAGLISGYSAVTIETWASFGALPVNCFFWGFGSTDSSGAGEDYVFCAPEAGRIAITGVDPGWEDEQNASTAINWSSQTNVHIVAVFNPPANSLALYTNGVLAAINNAITTPISAVNDVYSYIGRSLYTVDPYAPLDVAEFRIYNGALSAQQVALDAASGPSNIIANPGALLSVQLTVTNQMSAGGTQSAMVTGNFASLTNVNLFTYGPPALVSDNTNVLTISSAGLITALVPGVSANIIASYGGLSATQNITVAGLATNLFVFNSFGDGFWSISNQGNGNVLVETSGGASQEVYTNGAAEQQFEVLYNIRNGSFRLRQHSNWFCIGAQSTPLAVGGAVTFAPFYTAEASQQWYLVNAGGGYYRIFNAASNLVLQTDNGTPASVTLARASTSPFQLWQFNYQTHYPKKGCAGYEGEYSQFGLDWAYNYNDNTSIGLPASVDFVPMVDTEYWEPLSDLQSRDSGWLAQPQPAYLLGYNEPDNPGTASTNPSTNEAVANWPSLMALGVPLVGPAMQNEQDSWENSFYAMIASDGYRVDYSAVHLYVPPNSSSVISDLQSEFNAYGRPVWLTEFSPVDWSGNQAWTEDDDYNFLAEFMWLAEGNDWLKRYAIFPFSGSNPNPPYTSVTAGYRGNFFESDGVTLTPYGELYSTWDGNTTLQTRTPYLIHNLGTSFRLTSTNSSSAPVPQDIYVRDPSAQWALLPSPSANQYYIISLKDGRRLCNNAGNPGLAPLGATNSNCRWWMNGPTSLGYYYIDNLSASQSIEATGTVPGISFGMINDPAPSAATEWRLIKPYHPVAIITPVPPAVGVSYSSQGAKLTWTGNGSFFNIYRSSNSSGNYSLIANAVTNTSYFDSALRNGTPYYYVVTALDILGEESGYSAQVAAYPASTLPPPIIASNFNLAGQNGIQVNWPADHTGWRLMVQTNNLASGISLNTNDWMTVVGSQGTNQIIFPLDATKPAEFYRLIYP